MSRWFRVYADLVDNPKYIKLGPDLRCALFAVWCIAAGNDGKLPSLDFIAIKFRLNEARTNKLLVELERCGFLDRDDDGTLRPHDWDERQFQSDTSNERVKRHRQRKRNVTVTPPETDTETEQITEAKASDAGASDPRTRLFNEGLAKLASLTGKGPDSCRSFLGKCLKEVGDDAIVVLAAIEDAERNQVIDPSAYISRLLKGRSNGQSGSKIIQASDDLRRKIASFDGPSGGDQPVRSGPGAAAVRLLPNG